MDILNQITPNFSELGFWLRVIGTIALWYLIALLFAHLLFGNGREAVSSARSGMWGAMAVVFIALGCAAYFWWSAGELYYTLTLLLTFFLLTLVLLLLLSRLGSRE